MSSDGAHEWPSQIRGVHAGSEAAEVAEVVVGAGEWGDGVERVGGLKDEPTQANTTGKRLDWGETASLDEVDVDGVWAGEAVGAGSVEVGSWLWEAGKEVGVAVGRAFPVLQGVGVCGEELQPALYTGVVFADLGDVLQRFMVGVDEELGRPKMASEALDGPDDATGFEVEGGPCSLVVEGGAADEKDGADGAVGLFLFERCTETVDAGVAVEAEGAGVVGDSVPVRVDQDRGCG